MKKNKFSFAILLFLSIVMFLLLLFLMVNPLRLPVLDEPVRTVAPQPEEIIEAGTGTIREDFHEAALPYVSSSTSCLLDYVDPPIILGREGALERIKLLSETYPDMMFLYDNETLYPDNILIAVANNPEMLYFALDYITPNQHVYGFYTQEELNSDYPLFLQWDYRWGYMPYGTEGTMGTSGCGPTSLAMAIFYLTRNEEITPDVVAQYSLDYNYYVKDVGTAWSFMDFYPTLFDLKVSHVYLNEAYLKAELDKGNVLICSVRPGNFTYGGHFIVIYGYDETGFKINDPKCSYRSQLTWTFDQIKNDIRRTWSIGE